MAMHLLTRNENLLLLLSKDFFRLITVAVVLTAPVAWFINNLWLQTMSNCVDHGAGLFLLSTGALLAIALLTIGSQTVRAAQSTQGIRCGVGNRLELSHP